jgi:group I intron endonuclease
MGYIYILTFPNGKEYVGQTTNLKSRYKTHCKKSRSVVDKAIKKYGWDNIRVIELECQDELLDKVEIETIKLKNSLVPNGYNIESGGFSGKKLSEETKRKISEKNKGDKNHMFGKHLSEEAKNKMRISKSGNNHPMFGKHFSEEHRRKISCSLSGINHPMYGKKHSTQTKEKLAIAAKGNSHAKGHKHSLDVKRKIKEKLTGRICSLETKEKIRKGVLANLKLRQGDIV